VRRNHAGKKKGPGLEAPGPIHHWEVEETTDGCNPFHTLGGSLAGSMLQCNNQPRIGLGLCVQNHAMQACGGGD
jgi:hypothetical protein